MANYTVVVGGGGSKVQSEGADPVAHPELCMSPTTALGESYSPGDTLFLADTGGDYRVTWYTPDSGDVTTSFYQKAYPGHTPVINGADLATGWVNHSGNVWKKTGITTEPSMVFFDDTTRGDKKEFLVDLAAERDWIWLADVVYVYTTNASGPDAEWTTVELTQRQYCMNNLAVPYVTTDGIEFKHSNWLSVYITQGSNFNTFVNCHAHHSMVGFKVADDDCLFDSCITEWHTGDGFGVSGSITEKCNRLTITGCISRENMYIEGVNTGSGTGIKAFGMRYALITKSTWNDNDQGGIRLDGGGIIGESSYWGCEYNTISENLIYENGGVGGIDGDPSQVDQIMLEFSDYNHVKFNLVYDCVDGGYNIGLSRAGSCYVYGNITWGATGTSVGSIRTYFGAGGSGRTNYFIGNITAQSYWGFSFNGSGYEYLRNNIMSGCTNLCIRWGSSAAATGYDGDYNCFHKTGDIVKIFPTGYTFAEWQIAGYDLNSINEDPLFTNPATHDYTLQAGSPCIGTGANTLGPPYNEGLMPGSTWPDGVVVLDRDDY